MATLTQTQVNQLWKAPKNRAEIVKGAKHNIRQSFHAKLSQDESEAGPYLRELLKKVKDMLNNAAKFKKFKSILSFPLPSNLLISKAADEWNKVFYAQDRSIEYVFQSEEFSKDFQAFLKRNSFDSVIEQVLFTKIKQALNTVAVVDIPLLQEGDVGITEPYVYFLDIAQIKDVDVNPAGEVLYLMFEVGTYADKTKQLIVIDDLSYRVYDINQQGQEALSKPIVESVHNLGYCPACFIWRDPIETENSVCRFNTVSESLDDMEKLVIWDVFSQHTDLYAAFPVMYEWEGQCSSEEEARRQRDIDEGVVTADESVNIGPGHIIKVTVPEGDNFRMSAPVGFVNADAQLLVYVKERVIRTMEIKIIKHLTGVDNEIQNEKAFNESQIRSQYETRHSVLRYWAENVQYVHKFLVETMARLRYGDLFVSCTIDYGMDYFLYDTHTATAAYLAAKQAGLPEYILTKLRKIMEQAITRSSPSDKALFEVKRQLEPYPDRRLDELDPLTPEWELKANFSFYIDKFEREHGNLVNFGLYIDWAEKINLINSILYDYVKEQTKFSEENSRQPRVRELGQGQQASGARSVA